jgi:hypothetical protein
LRLFPKEEGKGYICSNVIRRGVYGNLALRTKDEHHGMQLFKGTVSRDFIFSSDAFPHAETEFLKARSDAELYFTMAEMTPFDNPRLS